MKKKWIVAEKKSEDLIEHLLKVRGISDKEAFLHPQFQNRHDPFLLSNLDTAVERLAKAVKDRETIGLYGDYDCDGIPGTALLWRGLKEIGAEPIVYIPRREVGYGLANDGIDALAAQGVKILITIDNGTTALEQVLYARGKGLEVIITDHHEPHASLPEALILNPKLANNPYPFRELCGSGVVYKLLEGLGKEFPGLDEKWLKWHLDLVALATICDMVELTGENRVFAKYGLQVLQKSRNVGLQALLKVAGVNPEVLSAGTVGFGLGPRINAAGRMESDPMLGFQLLTTEDSRQAETIAHQLHGLNLERQDLVSNAMIEAESLLKETGQNKAPAIALQRSSWTAGILGLIASRLLERYHKPVFIFDAKSGKGSARSIIDFPLPEAMEVLSKHSDSYGGHALAGGMSLKKGAFDQFKADLLRHAVEKLGSEERIPHLHIDAEINVGDIHPSLAKQLEQLEPFGIGNPKPLFALRGIRLADVKTIGNGSKHLRGTITDKGTRVPFVAFGSGERKEEFSITDPVDLAGKIELNTWNGRTTTELHVVDISV